MTILPVKVLTPLKISKGRRIIAWLPTTMITAIVSPIARPTPNTKDAIIPERADGKITL